MSLQPINKLISAAAAGTTNALNSDVTKKVASFVFKAALIATVVGGIYLAAKQIVSLYNDHMEANAAKAVAKFKLDRDVLPQLEDKMANMVKPQRFQAILDLEKKLDDKLQKDLLNIEPYKARREAKVEAQNAENARRKAFAPVLREIENRQNFFNRVFGSRSGNIATAAAAGLASVAGLAGTIAYSTLNAVPAVATSTALVVAS